MKNNTRWNSDVSVSEAVGTEISEKDNTADVVVIGGGLAGTVLAYKVSGLGKRVVLLEHEPPESSVTAHTTAFLTHIVDTRFDQLVKMFGEESARMVWQSHAWAVDEIERIIDTEHISCDFERCHGYIYASEEKQWSDVEQEATSAKKHGFDVHLTKEKGNLPFTHYGYYTVENQAKFHPMKFVAGLRDILQKRGVRVIQAHAETLSEGKGGATIVHTSIGYMAAEHVYIATYDPFNRPKELLFHRGTYITYILEVSIPKGLLPIGIYEDMDNPYNYFRIDSKEGDTHDTMIVGGEDHRHEVPVNEEWAYGKLEEYIQFILGKDQKYTVKRKWSGPILETIDGLAFIGRYDTSYPNRYLATGFSGNGMTYSIIASDICMHHLQHTHSQWEKIYSPQRKVRVRNMFEKAVDYIEELYHGAIKNILGIKKYE